MAKSKRKAHVVTDEAKEIVKKVRAGEAFTEECITGDVVRIFKGDEGVEAQVDQNGSVVMYPAEKSAQLKKSGASIEEVVSSVLRCHRGQDPQLVDDDDGDGDDESED